MSLAQSKFEDINVDGATLRAYMMVGSLQDEPFKDKRLLRKTPDSKYEIVTTKPESGPISTEKTLHGWYDFVIMVDEPRTVYLRRERFAADARSREKYKGDSKTIGLKVKQHAMRGHSSIARGGPVLFAGSVYFDKGELSTWENKSGHYLVAQDIFDYKGAQATIQHAAEQTQFAMTMDNAARLLPINLFQPINPRDF